MGKRNGIKGRYIPKHPEKYMGKEPPIYRSSYELHAFKVLDLHPAVKKWGSEIIPIPYESPLDGEESGKRRRYFPDLFVEYMDKYGRLRTVIIEIKPKSQTIMPERGKKSLKTYQDQLNTYRVNIAKWQAASKFCESKGYEFRIVTEEHLFKGTL